jgi:SEC-C motif-containing protein
MSMSATNDCPCGSARAFGDCCGPIIDGTRQADRAEAVMRSRYCAYVLANLDYLRTSWHPATRPPDLAPDASMKWLGLKVVRSSSDGDTALVEFVARYKVAGRGYRMHEISRFLRVKGRWLYLSGEHGATDRPLGSSGR